MPPARLVTPRRWDLAVKWRLFSHLLNGGDPDAERVYLWHIEQRSGARMRAGLSTDQWKRGLDDYLRSAIALVHSMAKDRFSPTSPIPIDPDGELLDGSHRVGCALALGLETVPVVRRANRAWAPAWDEAWFVANGMSGADLERLRADYGCIRY